jgi:hypothetical protein
MSAEIGSGLDRRETLYWMGLVSALVVTGCKPAVPGLPSATAHAQGYGKDPSMTAPKRTWPLTLSPTEKSRLAAIADVILPATALMPAPSALGIDAFFDEWLSAPYPDQQADRALILPLASDHRPPTTLVERLGFATDAAAPALARFRLLVVAACYTTSAGMTAIGYIGNEPRATFDGPPPAVLAHFDAEAAKLPAATSGS